MYRPRVRVYGFPQGGEAIIEIGRRELLVGAASLGFAGIAGPLALSPAWDERLATPEYRWHPLTHSLLDRAKRTGKLLDRPRVERIVHEAAASTAER